MNKIELGSDKHMSHISICLPNCVHMLAHVDWLPCLQCHHLRRPLAAQSLLDILLPRLHATVHACERFVVVDHLALCHRARPHGDEKMLEFCHLCSWWRWRILKPAARSCCKTYLKHPQPARQPVDSLWVLSPCSYVLRKEKRGEKRKKQWK